MLRLPGYRCFEGDRQQPLFSPALHYLTALHNYADWLIAAAAALCVYFWQRHQRISLQQKTAAALRESEQKFRALTETTTCGIIVYRDNDIIYVNPAGEQITGYSRTELLAMKFWELVHPDFQAVIRERGLARQRGEEVPNRYELKILTKDGQERWLDYSATPGSIYFDGQLCALGTAYDITQRKQVKAVLQRVNEELEERVQKRTGELKQANEQLRLEIAERQQAEEELLRQNQRSQLLAEITLKIRESLQWEEILQVTVTEVRSLLQADRALILQILPHGSGTKVVMEAVVAHQPPFLGKTFPPEVFPPEYHQLYQQGRVQTIENVATANIAPCHAEFLRQLGVQAKLVVPILQGEELWGLLIAHQCQHSRQWAYFEVELLQQLANQAGIALSQAQLLAAVQESEKQFRQLTENINEVFWIFQPDIEQIIYISPAYEKVWGRDRESLYQNAQTWFDAIHPEDLPKAIAAIQERQHGGKFFDEEYRIIRPDGSQRWIWAREFPIRNEWGEIYRIAGIGEDITESKQAEAEIHKALAQEKELSELKTRFISMASHEFRTPLATILAASDLLKRFSHKLTEEKKQDRLNKIQTEVRNMTRLLEDVLIIGKAEAKKIDFYPLPLDLNQFCQDILEEIELATAATHIIKFKIEGDCEDANMDQKLLRQILVNLLSNAVKYSPANSTIIFEVIRQPEKIIFKIQDQGIGIPAKDKPHLFNTFHRGSNVSHISGTGLGLAIVNNAVELHGGTIDLESEVGLGTTFTVCLPVGLISDENNSGY